MTTETTETTATQATAAQTTEVVKFEVGKTYTTRSPGDHECIILVTIVKRTAKTVSGVVRGEMKTFRPSVYRGAETIMPWGTYSMAPCLTAK